MPKKIGIDLDGVLADFDRTFYPAAWQRGLLLSRVYFDQKNHAFETSFPGEITSEQVTEILMSPGFYRQMDTIPCLVKMTRGFAEKGWEIHLVTARPNIRRVVDDTMSWLQEKHIPFYCTSFIPADEKYLFAQEQRLDLFVEDRLETANAFALIRAMCSNRVVDGSSSS